MVRMAVKSVLSVLKTWKRTNKGSQTQRLVAVTCFSCSCSAGGRVLDGVGVGRSEACARGTLATGGAAMVRRDETRR